MVLLLPVVLLLIFDFFHYGTLINVVLLFDTSEYFFCLGVPKSAALTVGGVEIARRQTISEKLKIFERVRKYHLKVASYSNEYVPYKIDSSLVARNFEEAV